MCSIKLVRGNTAKEPSCTLAKAAPGCNEHSTLLTQSALEDEPGDRARHDLCSTDFISLSVSLLPAEGQYSLSGMPLLLCVPYFT